MEAAHDIFTREIAKAQARGFLAGVAAVLVGLAVIAWMAGTVAY
jgi:hypothetical protein